MIAWRVCVMVSVPVRDAFYSHIRQTDCCLHELSAVEERLSASHDHTQSFQMNTYTVPLNLPRHFRGTTRQLIHFYTSE